MRDVIDDWRACEFVMQEFMEKGYVVLNDVFGELGAEIADELPTVGGWSLQVCGEPEGPTILSGDEIASASVVRHGTLYEISAEHMCLYPAPGVLSLARKSFAYQFCTLFEEDWAVTAKMGEFMMWAATAWPKDIGQLLDTKGLSTIEELRYTKYSAGAFLGSHSDGVGQRKIAFVANFTKGWRMGDGGFMIIRDRERSWHCVAPRANSLVLIDVRDGGAEHAVVPVLQACNAGRFAMTGWLA
jgi:hypothetical protein